MPGRSRADRAVTPVVEKVITIGLVVLFVGGTTTALFGGAVPTYRDAVGDELGERILATATERVEAAVPPNGTDVTSRTRVDLPASIRGSPYSITASGTDLVLEHPRESVGDRMRPALPAHVAGIEGEWRSGTPLVVTVREGGDGLVVELGGGDA